MIRALLTRTDNGYRLDTERLVDLGDRVLATAWQAGGAVFLAAGGFDADTWQTAGIAAALATVKVLVQFAGRDRKAGTAGTS